MRSRRRAAWAAAAAMSTGWAWVGTRSFTARPPNLLWSWLNVLAFAIVCRAWSPLRGRGSRCSRDRLSARLFGLPRLGRGGAAGCSASRGREGAFGAVRRAPVRRGRLGRLGRRWGRLRGRCVASVLCACWARRPGVCEVPQCGGAVHRESVMVTGRCGAYCRASSSAAAIAAWCADCCVWCRGAASGARPAWVAGVPPGALHPVGGGVWRRAPGPGQARSPGAAGPPVGAPLWALCRPRPLRVMGASVGRLRGSSVRWCCPP